VSLEGLFKMIYTFADKMRKDMRGTDIVLWGQATQIDN
jgi:hypothetical protein